jgi:ATP-dependent Zn protease
MSRRRTLSDLSDEDLMFHLETENLAYHEAGHALAGVSLGWQVQEVRFRDQTDREANAGGMTLWEDDEFWKHPLFGGTVRACRAVLRMVVAGPVAERLATLQSCFDEKLPTYQDTLDDEYLDIPEEPIEGSDAEQARDLATKIIQARIIFPDALHHARLKHPDLSASERRYMALTYAYRAAPTRDEMMGEIRRAERSAVRLLLKNWAAVDKLAQALQKRGRLTGKQVLRVLGWYDKPLAA